MDDAEVVGGAISDGYDYAVEAAWDAYDSVSDATSDAYDSVTDRVLAVVRVGLARTST
jgi:hypothetical protein